MLLKSNLRQQKVILQRLLFFGEVEKSPSSTRPLPCCSTRSTTEQQLRKSSTRLGEKPSLHELLCYTYTTNKGIRKEVHLRDCIASEWKELGIVLKFESAELRAIEKSNSFQVKDCCLEILDLWLQGHTCDKKPITWETLLMALMEVGCTTVVEQVWGALSDTDLPAKPDKTVLHDGHTYQWLPFFASLVLLLCVLLGFFPQNPIVVYHHYLREYYRVRDAYPLYSKPVFNDHRPERPLNLVLVHREKDESDRFYEEQMTHSFHGKVDEIQKQKTPVKIEEIGFNSSSGQHVAHFVLIEGAPGVGKSTLCWQLCRLWSEGKLRHKWDLMVLVEIRDETIRKAKDVYDLLYHPDDSVRKSIAQEIIEKRDGEGLFIIFDGYDELSDDQRSGLSIFQKILKDRTLHKATVVVTSRPIATKSLPPEFKQRLDQHVVIAGFNETDIQTYISLTCEKNSRLLEDFRSYVSSRPFIFSVMYNPLHCSIVTELYIENWQRGGRQGFTPNTLTELYNTFLLNLLRRHLDSSNESADIEELSDLSTHLYNNLMQLAELAAKGLKEKKYIYDKKYIESNTLGLMVSVRRLYDNRAKRTAYMFLHLTLQEYLAAIHWSQQPRQQLRQLMQKESIHIIMRRQQFSFHDQKEGQERTHSATWPLLLFLAGLEKLDSFPLEIIMPNNDPILPVIIGPFCQLLFEAQSPQLVSRLFSFKKSIAKTVVFRNMINSSLDWFSKGYCIANSDNTSSWVVTLDEFGVNLQMLSDGMHYSIDTQIWDERFGPAIEMRLTADFLKTFSRLYPFSKAITQLRILYADLELDDKSVSVLQNLSYFCPKLTLLVLPELSSSSFMDSFQLPKETLSTMWLTLPHHSVLFERLHEYKALKEMHLSSLNKETDICPSMQANLPKLAGTLESLTLSEVSINHLCINALAYLLKFSLSQLALTSCAISSNGYEHLTNAIIKSELKTSTSLVLRLTV